MTTKKQLTDLDLTKIKKLSESFSAFVLDGIPSKGMCLQTCYPLYLYLINKHNPKSFSLRNGTYEKINHYWINIEDSEETVIDPTITQFAFAENMPLVYIGMKPCCYAEKDGFKLDHKTVGWQMLLNFSLNEIYTSDGIPTAEEVNLNDFRQVILKGAIVINNEADIKAYPDYLSCVKKLLCEYSTDKELEVFSDLEGFCKLKDICICK